MKFLPAQFSWLWRMSWIEIWSIEIFSISLYAKKFRSKIHRSFECNLIPGMLVFFVYVCMCGWVFFFFFFSHSLAKEAKKQKKKMIIIITSDLRLLHHLLFSLHHHFHHLSIFPSHHHHHHHNCIVFLLLPTHYYCFSADRQKPGFQKMPKSGQKWSKEKDSRPSKWMNGVRRRNIGSNGNKSDVVFPQLINMHVLCAKSQWIAPRITCCLHCKMKAVVNRTCLIMLVGRWFVENHFTMQSAVESSNLLQ